MSTDTTRLLWPEPGRLRGRSLVVCEAGAFFAEAAVISICEKVSGWWGGFSADGPDGPMCASRPRGSGSLLFYLPCLPFMLLFRRSPDCLLILSTPPAAALVLPCYLFLGRLWDLGVSLPR